MAGLSDIIQKFTRPPEEIRNANLRAWVSTVEGATPLSQITPRQHYKVAGVIQNIRIDPRQGTGSVEATIIDGSGQMVCKWLGRQSMSGIRLGMGVVAEGIVGENAGQRVMLNPEYQLVPGPEHG